VSVDGVGPVGEVQRRALAALASLLEPGAGASAAGGA